MSDLFIEKRISLSGWLSKGGLITQHGKIYSLSSRVSNRMKIPENMLKEREVERINQTWWIFNGVNSLKVIN